MKKKRNRLVKVSDDVWKILGDEKEKNRLDSRDAVIESLIKLRRKKKSMEDFSL